MITILKQVLEAILNAKWYADLFKKSQQLFGDQIYAYYFNIPFEETMKRHKTRHEHSFGGAHGGMKKIILVLFPSMLLLVR